MITAVHLSFFETRSVNSNAASGFTNNLAAVRRTTLRYWRREKRGGSPQKMDAILMILFGSLISTTTALTFVEVRRLRKELESK